MLNNLDELRTFCRIADEGSLSAAARSLRLSVNAISRRLCQLEERLGVRLAQRTTRRLTLTEEGTAFAHACRRILESVDAAEEEMRGGVLGLKGTVRVGLHPAAIQPALLGELDELLESNPELRVHLLAFNAPQDPVKAGVDLMCWYGEVPLQSVVAKRLTTVNWSLACSQRYATRRGVPRTPAHLLDHRCLRALRERSESHWQLQDTTGKVVSARVGGQFESDDTEVLHRALHCGLGIGLRPRGEVETMSKQGVWVHVLPEYTVASLSVSLVSPVGRLRLSRVRAVAQLVERAIQAMA